MGFVFIDFFFVFGEITKKKFNEEKIIRNQEKSDGKEKMIFVVVMNPNSKFLLLL